MMSDKNQAVIDYLITCPTIRDNPLFFNFADEKDNNNQLTVQATETNIMQPFIDGSVSKRFSFNIYVYKSVAFNPVVKLEGYTDENVSDLIDVQAIIDWITEQNEEKNFPNFGPSCIIDSIEATTDIPVLEGVNSKTQPTLVQYSVGINIEYIDISKSIWNK